MMMMMMIMIYLSKKYCECPVCYVKKPEGNR